MSAVKVFILTAQQSAWVKAQRINCKYWALDPRPLLDGRFIIGECVCDSGNFREISDFVKGNDMKAVNLNSIKDLLPPD